MKIPQTILVLLPVLALCLGAGCASRAPGDDTVVAQVRNRSVTVGDFKARLARLPAYYRNIVEKNKRAYLEDVVMEMVFYEEAVRSGLGSDREVQDLSNEARKKILITKYIKNEIDDKAVVSDDEVRAAYEARKAEFKTPALYRASHILVATDAEARAVLAELAGGAKFEDIARARSLDATASRGGDIGFFRVGQLVPEFEKAVLKLKIGETGDVLHTQFGYHIIRLTDKKEPGVEPYDKVKEKIRNELRTKKRDELLVKLIQELKERYTVAVKDDVLKGLETTPASAVAGPAKKAE